MELAGRAARGELIVTMQSNPQHARGDAQAGDATQPMAAGIATPLMAIRDRGHAADARLRAWIRERVSRQLSKFGSTVERVDVRFGDDNGPKGGIDHACLVHVVLRGLPPIAVEVRAETAREAFDLAAGRAERATRHSVQKHGYSTKHKRRQRTEHGVVADAALDGNRMAIDDASPTDTVLEPSEDAIFGRREGRGRERLLEVQRGDGESRADAASVALGQGHTATRNTKLNTAGMSYDLEDSTTGKPSRKSTRKGKNRIKPASGLTLRTRSSLHSPHANAARSNRH
jgi:hypothetical protein